MKIKLKRFAANPKEFIESMIFKIYPKDKEWSTELRFNIEYYPEVGDSKLSTYKVILTFDNNGNKLINVDEPTKGYPYNANRYFKVTGDNANTITKELNKWTDRRGKSVVVSPGYYSVKLVQNSSGSKNKPFNPTKVRRHKYDFE